MKQYMFDDAEFMSSQEKLLVLKAWVRFLKNGLRYEDFSDRLYQHLIAHFLYNRRYARSGLYATHFENRDDTFRFLSDKLAQTPRSSTADIGGSMDMRI
jgi:hypothetical protein